MKTTVENPSNLLDALADIHAKLSKNKLRKMLTEGRIQVDGNTVHEAKFELQKGMQIHVLDRTTALKSTPPPEPKRKKINLQILWEDESILVVDKPAGLLSIATDRLEDDTLHSRCVDYVRQENEKNWCHIVHRLDRDTSGVMVFARHKRDKEYLQSQFAERAVYRSYHALVEGRPKNDSGTRKDWLVEDKHLRVKKVKSTFHGSKEAITHWEIADTDNQVSLIKISIDTGRRHQIRIAMMSLNCPVVGDDLHGAETDPFGRVCLHASALEFLHPESDEPVRFEASIPFWKES